MKPGRRGQVLFLSFSAAVFAAVYLLPVTLWPWLGLAVLAPAGLFFWRGRRLGTLLCLGVAAALLWCGAYRAVFFAPAQRLDGRRTTVTLRLSESPIATDYGARAAGWVVQEGAAPVQAVLYGDADLLELDPGDRVRVLANCSQTALGPEGRFTAQATRGVFLRLVAKGPVEVERTGGILWRCMPRRWGEALGRSVDTAAASDPDAAGLLKAMVTGDRSGIDGGLSTQLKRSGLAHLVAVSGMHVCFLVDFLTRLTGYDPRRRAAVCAPVVVFFTLAVGCAPSVMRACCLQLAVLAAEALGRETERWTALFGTLALLLLLDPFSAANVGLQLSFAAVAGIALVSPPAQAALSGTGLKGEGPWTRRLNGILHLLAGTLIATLGAALFTAPLSAWYFGTFCLAAPVTNLLVLPVAGALFAGTLTVGLIGMGLPALAGLLARPLIWLARYVLGVSGAVAAFPYSCLPLRGVYYPVAFAVLCVLALIALLGRGRRQGMCLLCAVAVVWGSVLLARLDCRLTTLTAGVLDVGQGQSVVLMSGGRTAVIDCGGTGYDDPGDVCADYLQARGESRVDALILTHYHADHVSGLAALFRRLDVEEVVLPAMEHDEKVQLEILALAAEEGARVTWLDADRAETLGEMALRFYAPMGTGGANEEGLSVLIAAGAFTMLVTGDMNEVVEERLVQKADLPHCQALVAGHHGSATSTGEALLNAVAPETALISVGADNPYGHPDPEALERLAAWGADVYRTDQLGTLTIQVR